MDIKLQTTFRSKGRDYSLALSPLGASRDEADENFTEWLVFHEDGRVLEITVWKDSLGRYTKDGLAEVYASRMDYNARLLLDKKQIKVKEL